MSDAVDINLLFAVLAMQNHLVDQADLIAAFHVWAGDQSSPLGSVLRRRGAISEEDHKLVAALVERHLIKYRGDARSSLDAVAGSGARAVRGVLADPEVRRTLAGRLGDGNSLGETLAPSTAFESSRYAYSRLLAEGGLGKIWVARDTALNREVALKEMQPSQSGRAEVLRRFLKEAQITGQLEHPNIVPVYELSRRAEDNQPFYTMRYIRGRTLREAIAQHFRDRADGREDPLARPRLLQAFISVCQAVGYAHSRGVIHRDLKPENIVVGGFGEVIVLDWGLAKLVGQAEEDAGPDVALTGEARTDVTGAGRPLGTPAYMAPEQAAGRTDLIGVRTDIYGLGAILFEMLCGRAPHEGKDISELLRRIAAGDSPRLRAVDRTVPQPLEAICARAMARLPSERYESASALADDVQRWLADEPVSVFRESVPQRLRRWRRRHRTAVRVAAGLLAAVGLVAASAAVADSRRLARLRADAERLVDRADSDLLNGDPDSSRAGLAEALGRIGDEPRLPRLRARADRLRIEAERRIEQGRRRREDRARAERFWTAYDESMFHGTFLTGRADSLGRSAAEARTALQILGYTDDEAGSPPDPSGLQLDPRERSRLKAGCCELLLLMARAEARASSHDRRPDAIPSKARAARRAAHAARLLPTVRAGRLWAEPEVSTSGPATASEAEADLAEAVDHFLVGVASYDDQDLGRAGLEFDAALRANPDHYWAQYFLALCHLRLRRWGEAKAALNACLSRKVESHWAYMLRGYVSGELLDFEAAERDFARAQKLADDDYGVYVNRGAMRIRRGAIAEAVDDLGRAVSLEPEQYAAYANLARALAAQRRWAEAIAHIDRAVRLAPELASLRRNRARLLLESGAEADAWREYDEALRLEPADRPFALLLRAESELGRGRYAEAVRAFDLYERKGAVDASFYQGRGLAKALLGDYPGAVADYTRSLEQEPNTNVLARRGWAYLLASESLALHDFDRSLGLNTKNLDARAGKGYALVRLGRYRDAVAEADRVDPAALRDWPMAFNVACVYAQAVAKALGDTASPDREDLATRYRGQAEAMLRTALERVEPPGRRPEAWRRMTADSAVDPIRDGEGFRSLERQYGAGEHEAGRGGGSGP